MVWLRALIESASERVGGLRIRPQAERQLKAHQALMLRTQLQERLRQVRSSPEVTDPWVQGKH